MRHYTALDKLVIEVDHAVQTLFADHRNHSRPYPAENIDEAALNDKERQHVGGLMRVNHTGEVCAQALYQGQALTADLHEVREQMEEAAQEEIDHLAWCEQRLHELGERPSYLNPLWFLGAFTMGAVAGKIGDKWSLGFVVETERQVIEHLHDHLGSLPQQDKKTSAILSQMQAEEAEHGHTAEQAGAARFPAPVKFVMRYVSKIMTTVAYYI